jgi:hypothetical protein
MPNRTRLVAAILVALAIGATPARASSPRPDPLNSLWPVCVDPGDWFCVESATRDGVDILSGDGRTVDDNLLYVNAWFLDDNSVNWSVTWSSTVGVLPASVADSTFRLVLRTGDLQPLFTPAYADRFFLTTAGDGTNGYLVTVEGSPTDFNWRFAGGFSCQTNDCGDDTTQATLEMLAFSGNTQNMAFWDPDEKARFGGMYLATNAQAASTVVIYAPSPEPHWYLDLANPHLSLAGPPATGSFMAWIPPSYFTGVGTTPEDAVAAGFGITRTDGGIDSSVTGAASLVDGGVYVRIPLLNYSAPRLTVAPLGGGTPTPIAPDPPSLTGATADRAAARLAFTAPRFNGGAAVTAYVGSCTQDATTRTAMVDGSATSLTVAGLAAATTTCTVHAVNAGGDSDESHSLTVTPLPAGVPDAPGNVVVTPDVTQVTVSFTAPASDGGSPITAYGVRCVQGGTPHVTALPASTLTTTVGSLYTQALVECTVHADNAVGTSAESEIGSATTSGGATPSAPTNLSVVVGKKVMTVTWGAPDVVGSSDVASYLVQVCKPNKPCSGKNVRRSQTVQGLTVTLSTKKLKPGKYVVIVTAVNGAGAGDAASALVKLTKKR